MGMKWDKPPGDFIKQITDQLDKQYRTLPSIAITTWLRFLLSIQAHTGGHITLALAHQAWRKRVQALGLSWGLQKVTIQQSLFKPIRLMQVSLNLVVILILLSVVHGAKTRVITKSAQWVDLVFKRLAVFTKTPLTAQWQEWGKHEQYNNRTAYIEPHCTVGAFLTLP